MCNVWNHKWDCACGFGGVGHLGRRSRGSPASGRTRSRALVAMSYELRQEVPSVESYIEVRLAAGLSRKSVHAASIGLKNGLFDLPPSCRTSLKLVKSVNQENDGHEEEQVHRRTNHRLHPAG